MGHEVSELLQAAGVSHALVDGDSLDPCYPVPDGDPRGTALTEANLGALWASCTAAGHDRLVYVNTVPVLEAPMVLRAVGGAGVIGVLLTADDEVVGRRLAGREIGSALERHVERSATTGVRLEVAADVVTATGWVPTR